MTDIYIKPSVRRSHSTENDNKISRHVSGQVDLLQPEGEGGAGQEDEESCDWVRDHLSFSVQEEEVVEWDKLLLL